jgi:hypothetical protein
VGSHSNEVEPKTLDIVEQDSINSSHDVSLNASLTEPTLTTEHPPQIRAELVNTGEERYFTTLKREVIFDRERATVSTDASGLLLIWSDITEWLDSETPPWSIDPAEISEGSAGVGGTVLGANKSVQNQYEVWDHAGLEGYFEADTYRFETEIRILSSASEPATVVGEFEWGFSIHVSTI